MENDQGLVTLSEWRVALLEAIGQYGSLSAAARALTIPHRTAWERLREMEERLNVSLVRTSSGGAVGGATRLTPAAEELITAYHGMRDGLDDLIDERFEAQFGPSV